MVWAFPSAPPIKPQHSRGALSRACSKISSTCVCWIEMTTIRVGSLWLCHLMYGKAKLSSLRQERDVYRTRTENKPIKLREEWYVSQHIALLTELDGSMTTSSINISSLRDEEFSRHAKARLLPNNLQVQLRQLLFINRAGRIDHQVLRRSSFRKSHHVADIFRGYEHHHCALDARSDAAMGWRPVSQRVEKETKTRPGRLFTHAECFEDDRLDVATMNSDRAAGDFDAVDDCVISFRAQSGE